MARLDLDGRELAKGITVMKTKVTNNTTNFYKVQFRFKGTDIHVGVFPTPIAAAEALQKRRALAEANPEAEKKVRNVRTLPTGVSIKEGRIVNPYQASFSYKHQSFFVGHFPDPETAGLAVQAKRVEMKLPPYTEKNSQRAVHQKVSGRNTGKLAARVTVGKKGNKRQVGSENNVEESKNKKIAKKSEGGASSVAKAVRSDGNDVNDLNAKVQRSNGDVKVEIGGTENEFGSFLQGLKGGRGGGASRGVAVPNASASAIANVNVSANVSASGSSKRKVEEVAPAAMEI